jgi:MFS family permease
VAVGWQVYALTNNPFNLGMVGLAQFIPTVLLTFVAGHVADRYDRKRVVQICQIGEALTAIFFGLGELFRVAERAADFCRGGHFRRRHGF